MLKKYVISSNQLLGLGLSQETNVLQSERWQTGTDFHNMFYMNAPSTNAFKN